MGCNNHELLILDHKNYSQSPIRWGTFMGDIVKECPYCAEEIKDEAIKCKHCGSELTNKQTEPIETDIGRMVKRSQKSFSMGCVLPIVILFIVLIIIFANYSS